MSATKWYRLLCSKNELQLLGTLNGGQSFRWKQRDNQDTEQWIGVFNSKVWILEQKDDHILYQVYGDTSLTDNVENGKTLEKELREYFQLDLINLEENYKLWGSKDPNFKEAAEKFYGIRILKQDPVENIFSFICSQNNHISRISSMVEKLATFYGPKICQIGDISYHAFPQVDSLAQPGVEKQLRDNGFGYRAKYIYKSAQTISENGANLWLEKLQQMNYEGAKKKLMTLTGIGAKVADCICLMSLGHLDVVPVDTHVYQIAARFYLPKLAKQKTVTDKIYNEIGTHFRDLYGPLAGWAHTVLFCADLKKFQIPKKGEKLKADQEKKTVKNKKRC